MVTTLLLNGIMIFFAHLKFKAQMHRPAQDIRFQTPRYPLNNALCIEFLTMIVALLVIMPDTRISAILLPI